jgi:hypothetical protein
MTPIKIAVCDDTKEPLAGVVAKIEKLKPKGSPRVLLFSGNQVTRVARSLEQRRRPDSRRRHEAPVWGSHEFDDIDLLISSERTDSISPLVITRTRSPTSI